MCIETARAASPARAAVPAAVPTRLPKTKARATPLEAARPTRLPLTNRKIKELVEAVEAATLPRQEWRHAEHLILALDYARRYRPGEGMRRLRETLQRYNQATKTPETETRGYHETITLGWFHLVRHFLDVFDDGRSVAALGDALVELFTKETLFEHWSLERLRAPEAKAGWLEPDLKPLPALEEMTPEDRAWLASLDRSVGASLDRSVGASLDAARVASTPATPTPAVVTVPSPMRELATA